jgi:hypothetical protein
MLPLQFNELPLQVYVFAGILALLFISFLVFFVVRGVFLRVKLARLSVRPAPLGRTDDGDTCDATGDGAVHLHFVGTAGTVSGARASQ